MEIIGNKCGKDLIRLMHFSSYHLKIRPFTIYSSLLLTRGVLYLYLSRIINRNLIQRVFFKFKSKSISTILIMLIFWISKE